MNRLALPALLALTAFVGLWASTPPADAAPQRPASAGAGVGGELLAIPSAASICFKWRPHTGDGWPTAAFYYFWDPFLVKTQCVVPHPPSPEHPNGGTHTFCVYTRRTTERWIPGCADGF